MRTYSLPVNRKLVDIRSAPSHQGRTKHCIDFALPLGTPVKAAACGTVLRTESRFNRAYSDYEQCHKANHVIIRHFSGSISIYAHLQWRSVRVRKGQKVRRGQIIGLSGQTGYATYPHLHFGLYDQHWRNIPASFAD